MLLEIIFVLCDQTLEKFIILYTESRGGKKGVFEPNSSQKWFLLD